MGAIVANETGGRRTVDAFMDGFEASLLVAAVVAFAGAVVAAVFVRPHELRTEQAAEEAFEAAA